MQRVQMKLVKPASDPEKRTHTTVDTIELNQKLVSSWKSPPFQRALRDNAKVRAVAEDVQRAGGVLPGILTLGIYDGDRYLVDGQHRVFAWQQTGLEVGYADVRICWFDSLGEMASEFVRLNSSLVRLKTDDLLRGLEPSSATLQRIRRKCGFIGYDNIRRGDKSPVLSMSTFVRVWAASRGDVPRSSVAATEALESMTDAETSEAIEFANICYEAWKRDPEYARLWSTVNMTLCAWLYRKLVLGEGIAKNSRSKRMSKEDFRRCLLALSAESTYLEFLVGRNMGERDRAPAYGRLKAIFQRRYHAENGERLTMPAPPWSHQ
jgi:hypothetical protein